MKKKIITIGVVTICVFIAVLPFLVKVKVNCKSQFGNCPDEINAKLYKLNSKSLFSAKRDASSILKNDSLISDFSTQFKIPDILHVDIIVKSATAAFKEENSNVVILSDKNGMVLSNAANSNLPQITVTDNLPKIGQNIGANYLFAQNLAIGVNQMYQISESNIEDGSLLVELPGQIRVIFPLEGDSQILLGSLRLIYSKIQASGNTNKYSQIDLRFKNPVLR